MERKWLPLLNKDIRIWTAHGVYRGVFCGIMNNHLYARGVRIGWIRHPEIDCSKVSGAVKRHWPFTSIKKLEVMESDGSYKLVDLLGT